MIQYAEECRTLGVPFIFDPGQQCARMSGDELRDGITGARLVICNDYEFELIRQKTGTGRGRRPRSGAGADRSLAAKMAVRSTKADRVRTDCAWTSRP